MGNTWLNPGCATARNIVSGVVAWKVISLVSSTQLVCIDKDSRASIVQAAWRRNKSINRAIL